MKQRHWWDVALLLWRRWMEERMDMGSETHAMVFEQRTSKGFYIYGCPTCGRRIAIRYPDERRGIVYAKRVLIAGNVEAAHAGGSSDLPGVDLEMPGRSDPWPESDQHSVDDRDLPDTSDVPEAFRGLRWEDL